MAADKDEPTDYWSPTQKPLGRTDPYTILRELQPLIATGNGYCPLRHLLVPT
jgi:hypothetical protein